MLSYRHFKIGLRAGVPIGIAIAISSLHYTGSIVRAGLTFCAAALGSAFLLGFFEARAEQRRRERGITLSDPPFRAKLILALAAEPQKLVALCGEALRSPDFRLKRIEIDDPFRIVVLTKVSFYSFSERIKVEARAIRQDICELEISSVPRLNTTVADYGKNYTNIWLLAEFMKRRLGSRALISETLIDLDKTPDSLRPA